MLSLALLFLLIAIVAHLLGVSSVGGLAVNVAKLCLIIFVVLLLFTFVFGYLAPGPYWYYPLGGPRTVFP